VPIEAQTAAHFAFGEFTLDRLDERLIGPNGPVRLGRKSLEVLLALVEQHGRLVTKEALFSTVWEGTFVSEASLTTAIRELRRALGDESRTPRYIASVYGRGYRFIAQVEEILVETPARPPAVAPAGPPNLPPNSKTAFLRRVAIPCAVAFAPLTVAASADSSAMQGSRQAEAAFASSSCACPADSRHGWKEGRGHRNAPLQGRGRQAHRHRPGVHHHQR
jgi:DNA-binding winged helix-turn-helix (wHTH) protein